MIEKVTKTGKTWWLELSQSLLSVSCIQSVVTSSTGRRPLTKPKCGSFTQIYWHCNIWPSFLIHWLWPEKNFKCVYNWWKSNPCSIPASSKKPPASCSVQCPVSNVQCPASTAAVSSGQNWCVLTNRRFSISFHWGGAACRKVSGSGTGKGNLPQANDKNLNQRTRTTTNLNLIMMTKFHQNKWQAPAGM